MVPKIILPALNSTGNAFISLLFPNHCLVCNGGEIQSCDPICSGCFQKLTCIQLKNRVQELTIKDDIDVALSGWDFGEILRPVIHSLKYQERAKIGKFLGEKLGERLKSYSFPKMDYLIPVPLHPVKYRDRGFNQAEWIAIGLGNELGIKVIPHLMKRVKYTISQTTLNRKERLKNMKLAFRITKNVKEKNIGIVDDVLTTGSTISSMATVLKDAGAKSIVALTVATPLEKANDTYT